MPHLKGGGSSPSYTLNRPCSFAAGFRLPPAEAKPLVCRSLPGVPLRHGMGWQAGSGSGEAGGQPAATQQCCLTAHPAGVAAARRSAQ